MGTHSTHINPYSNLCISFQSINWKWVFCVWIGILWRINDIHVWQTWNLLNNHLKIGFIAPTHAHTHAVCAFRCHTKVNKSEIFISFNPKSSAIKAMNMFRLHTEYIVYFSEMTRSTTPFLALPPSPRYDMQRLMHADVLNHLEYLLLETHRKFSMLKITFWCY